MTKDIGKYVMHSEGKIWSKWKKDWIKPNLEPTGYLRCTLNNKRIAVHRIQALTFLPNPNNLPEINHKNGIKTDNRIENLEWISNSENQKHAYRLGLKERRYGDNARNVKLTEEQARKIKYELKHLKVRECAKIFSCSIATVSKIKSGKQWLNI